MSIRIYYTDAACLTFEAVVERVLEHDGHPAVVLDRTAFYPTSGGQPFDTGRLASANVLDVVDLDGTVVHVLDAPLPAGERVTGQVDAARRFDHMQQHTGQHVLSAAIDRLFDNRTVSFHLGRDICTIDLARELEPAQIDRAVEDANRIVWEDRPVAVRFVSADEAAALPLRKEPVREGPLRLVEVTGYDLSACGGTHVSSTGAVGIIAVTAWERFRGGSRLTFVCGRRALATFTLYRDAIAGTIRQLSVLPQELPPAVERLQAEMKELRKSASRFQQSLAGHEADRLLAGATPTAGVRLIAAALEGWDAVGLKAIASAATAHDGVALALVSTTAPHALVVARSRDVSLDAGAIVRDLTSRYGGRGGGKPELAQAGGISGDANAVLDAARQAIAKG